MISLKKARAICKRIEGLNILVIGDVMLDEYLWGKVHRISPEAPVPVVRVVDRTFNLGGATNVAQNLLSFGAKVGIVGLTGPDEEGRILRQSLVDKGIDVEGLFVDQGRRTTRKTRVIAYNQQVVRIDQEDDNQMDENVSQQVLEYLAKKIPQSDAIILSDYAKGVLNAHVTNFAIETANKHSLICSIDPKLKNFSNYKGAHVITPNHHEAGAACGLEIDSLDVLRQAGIRLLEETRSTYLLITWGKNGMVLFEDKDTYHHIETVSKRVFDVTGAGDTVISVFTMALTARATPLEAAMLANLAAGIVVSNVGTATVKPEEIYKIIKK